MSSQVGTLRLGENQGLFPLRAAEERGARTGVWPPGPQAHPVSLLRLGSQSLQQRTFGKVKVLCPRPGDPHCSGPMARAQCPAEL